MSVSFRPSLASLVVVAGLAGCAPVMVHAPPVPIPGQAEIGVGVGQGVGAHGIEGSEDVCEQWELCIALAAHQRFQIKEFELMTTSQLSVTGGFSFGAAGRYYFVRNKQLRVGVGAGLGFLSAQGGVPVAVRLAPKTWLYTEPRGMVGPLGAAGMLPVGFTYRFDKTLVGLELGAGYGEHIGIRGSTLWDGYGGYGALRVSQGFGEQPKKNGKR